MNATGRLDEIEGVIVRAQVGAETRPERLERDLERVRLSVESAPALVAALRAVLDLADRWVTLDGPHPGHDHMCPDWSASEVRGAIAAALDGTR